MQLRDFIFPEKQLYRSIDGAVTYFRKAIGQVIKQNFKLKEVKRL